MHMPYYRISLDVFIGQISILNGLLDVDYTLYIGMGGGGGSKGS